MNPPTILLKKFGAEEENKLAAPLHPEPPEQMEVYLKDVVAPRLRRFTICMSICPHCPWSQRFQSNRDARCGKRNAICHVFSYRIWRREGTQTYFPFPRESTERAVWMFFHGFLPSLRKGRLSLSFQNGTVRGPH